MRLVILLLLILGISSSPSRAFETNTAYLLDACKTSGTVLEQPTPPKQQAIDAGICLGYITAARHFLSSKATRKSQHGICIASDVTSIKLAGAFVAWAEDRKPALPDSMFEGLLKSWMEAFPCTN